MAGKQRQRILTSTIEFHGMCHPDLARKIEHFLTHHKTMKEWDESKDQPHHVSVFSWLVVGLGEEKRHAQAAKRVEKAVFPEVLKEFKSLVSAIESGTPDGKGSVPIDGSMVCPENGNGGN
jgi:hypothetical protein